MIIFGSFARREADRHSDIDALIVRPDGLDEDDETWPPGLEQWRDVVRSMTGNRVEIIETDRAEATEKLAGRQSVWRDIASDGVAVHSATLDELRGAVRA